MKLTCKPEPVIVAQDLLCPIFSVFHVTRGLGKSGITFGNHQILTN